MSICSESRNKIPPCELCSTQNFVLGPHASMLLSDGHCCCYHILTLSALRVNEDEMLANVHAFVFILAIYSQMDHEKSVSLSCTAMA